MFFGQSNIDTPLPNQTWLHSWMAQDYCTYYDKSSRNLYLYCNLNATYLSRFSKVLLKDYKPEWISSSYFIKLTARMIYLLYACSNNGALKRSGEKSYLCTFWTSETWMKISYPIYPDENSSGILEKCFDTANGNVIYDTYEIWLKHINSTKVLIW